MCLTFVQTFTHPYVNAVLPLFNKYGEPKLVDQVIGHLCVVLTDFDLSEEHDSAAITKRLVSFNNPA